MLLLASPVCGPFKWRQFEPEVILLAVGWNLRFSLSYREVEELRPRVITLRRWVMFLTIECAMSRKDKFQEQIGRGVAL